MPLPGHISPVSESYGYSCNVWFSLEIARSLFSTTQRRVWFSTVFNPTVNVDSSNPSEIYREVSRAVQNNDVGSRMIGSYRLQLLGLVADQEAKNNISASEANAYRQRISTEAIVSFRPEVWRLNLVRIAQRKYGVSDVTRLKNDCRQNAQDVINRNPPQFLQPDEYLILDLQDDEYDAIIIG